MSGCTCTLTNNAANRLYHLSPLYYARLCSLKIIWLFAEAGLAVRSNNNQSYNKVSPFPSFALSADKDDKCGSAELSFLCSHYSLISMTYSWKQKEKRRR